MKEFVQDRLAHLCLLGLLALVACPFAGGIVWLFARIANQHWNYFEVTRNTLVVLAVWAAGKWLGHSFRYWQEIRKVMSQFGVSFQDSFDAHRLNMHIPSTSREDPHAAFMKELGSARLREQAKQAAERIVGHWRR